MRVAPRSVKTNPVRAVEDWTRNFVECEAGRALEAIASEVSRMSQQLASYLQITDDLARKEVSRAPLLPENLEALQKKVTSLNNLFGLETTTRFNPQEAKPKRGILSPQL